MAAFSNAFSDGFSDGFDIDQQQPIYGGIGHYKLAAIEARQLAKITRKTPAPIDRTTRPRFAPMGSPPVAPLAPAPDVAAMQNQRMADEMRASAQAVAAKRRNEALTLLLLAS